MGEYFSWVNVDKKEYISPCDFDLGNKRYESIHWGNELLCALRELLSKEWNGDHIFFMGDQNLINKDTKNETLKILYEHSDKFGYPGDGFDTVYESYKNVSGLFKETEEYVREEIGFYLSGLERGCDINEYGIDISDPFQGLFQREGRDFIYTINHNKRVCYSFEKTKILFKDGEECDFADPLPILMVYGSNRIPGEWVGDIIGVSDNVPEGYEVLKEIVLEW